MAKKQLVTDGYFMGVGALAAHLKLPKCLRDDEAELIADCFGKSIEGVGLVAKFNDYKFAYVYKWVEEYKVWHFKGLYTL